ncbi:MAG: EamA family transporter [archaeon]
MKFKYPLFVFISYFIFGSMGIFTRLTGQNGIIIASAVSLFSAFAFLIWLNAKEFKGIFKDKFWFLVLIGILGAANNSLYFFAFNLTTISNAAFLHYLAPPIVLVLSLIFLKEKFTWKSFLAIVIATIGLIFILGKPTFSSMETIGNLFAIGSAISYAISFILYKKAFEHFNFKQILFMQMLVTFVIFSPFLFMNIFTITPMAWGCLLIVGLIHQFAAPALQFQGLKIMQATTVSIIGYTEIFFAVIFAWLVFSEVLTIPTLIGGVLIIFASYLALK